jgi:hypothetical protein
VPPAGQQQHGAAILLALRRWPSGGSYLQWAVNTAAKPQGAGRRLQVTERTLYRYLAALEKKTPAT